MPSENGPDLSPRLLDGERLAPPEDAGGPPGFMEVLEVLKDESHPRHKEIRAWVGATYDPSKFDAWAVDHALALTVTWGGGITICSAEVEAGMRRTYKVRCCQNFLRRIASLTSHASVSRLRRSSPRDYGSRITRTNPATHRCSDRLSSRRSRGFQTALWRAGRRALSRTPACCGRISDASRSAACRRSILP